MIFPAYVKAAAFGICEVRQAKIVKGQNHFLLGGYESPRVLRRLQILREWSHEQVKQVFPRSTRARRAHGARASQRVSIPMVGN